VVAIKLVVGVPATHTEAVLTAIGEAGGGQVGSTYDYCALIARGEGRFRPLEGSHPAIGALNQIERVSEDRIEVTITQDRLQSVIAAVRSAHPYEVPVIDIYSLLVPEDTL
jgi:hypothetical protein